MSIEQAVDFFTAPQAIRHKSYPVVDAAGRVVGMASRGDVLRWINEQGRQDQLLGEAASDRRLVLGGPDELVWRLVDRMVAEDVGRVPIVDADGRLVGIVARKDLLRVREKLRRDERSRSAYLGRGSRRG
jgi:CBS domain-containing protein